MDGKRPPPRQAPGHHDRDAMVCYGLESGVSISTKADPPRKTSANGSLRATQRLRQGEGYGLLPPNDLADPFDTL